MRILFVSSKKELGQAHLAGRPLLVGEGCCSRGGGRALRCCTAAGHGWLVLEGRGANRQRASSNIGLSGAQSSALGVSACNSRGCWVNSLDSLGALQGVAGRLSPGCWKPFVRDALHTAASWACRAGPLLTEEPRPGAGSLLTSMPKSQRSSSKFCVDSSLACLASLQASALALDILGAISGETVGLLGGGPNGSSLGTLRSGGAGGRSGLALTEGEGRQWQGKNLELMYYM